VTSAKLRYELNHVAEDRLLEAGLSLHAGMMRAQGEDARQHLRDALEALDHAIKEIRLAIIELDDTVVTGDGRRHITCDGRRHVAGWDR
jgi:hypothetical protein